MTSPLYRRIRAQCCPISGLTTKELDDHARHVTKVVTDARKNQAGRHHPQSSANRPDKKGQ